MYAVYHGPDGLREIGYKVHNATRLLALGNVIFAIFLRAMLLCHSMSSIRPSVCLYVTFKYTYCRLEYFKNNFTAD